MLLLVLLYLDSTITLLLLLYSSYNFLQSLFLYFNIIYNIDTKTIDLTTTTIITIYLFNQRACHVIYHMVGISVHHVSWAKYGLATCIYS